MVKALKIIISIIVIISITLCSSSRSTESLLLASPEQIQTDFVVGCEIDSIESGICTVNVYVEQYTEEDQFLQAFDIYPVFTQGVEYLSIKSTVGYWHHIDVYNTPCLHFVSVANCMNLAMSPGKHIVIAKIYLTITGDCIIIDLLEETCIAIAYTPQAPELTLRGISYNIKR